MVKDGKLGFSEAARFNYELDTNEKLKDGLRQLALCYAELTQGEYRERMLQLFNEAGISITARELEMLLLLRQKTDQILVSEQGMNGKEKGENT